MPRRRGRIVHSCHWELVEGNKWGSAVILDSGRIEPIEIPNYRGWVTGGEVHDSRLRTENRRLFLFSLHSPTSNPGNKRLSYIKEVDAIVTTMKPILSTDCDLIIGAYLFRHRKENFKENFMVRRHQHLR